MLVSVNVDVAVHREGRWLLIIRGQEESHAAGMLSLVGGTLEAMQPTSDVLEQTARREVLEEVGVRLDGDLRYVESTFFTTDDDGTDVVNVVLLGDIGDQAPMNAAPGEVSEVVWRTLDEVAADGACPPWTLQSLRRAAALVTDQ